MTSPSTTTSSSNRTGIGSKIKGAVQVAHGLGENVRGTILGGVETALHKDSAANDAIAERGRAEHADGMAKVARAPAAGVEGVSGAYCC
ncbi:hypothetical protein GGX14DRAFT_47764 [Mycena pura]|uniref:CsbD-like domain-containing protein n=1 Tax=Mycena pura TaxID=153505 RepID=A0AAD6UQD3_9AGAR|nr:hypothetical protein GGX14DRAFT_47764 [Mycena pura]